MLIGIIIGLLIAILIFTILGFFRAAIEQRIKVIEKQLGNVGPKQKGYIFEPKSEEDIVRDDIIERNKKLGKDTKIEELL